MPVWNVGPNKFNITGNDTLRSPWLEVTGPGERINNHWTFETLPNYAPQQVGFVDMGLHVVQPLARNEDRLTLAENGSFVLNVRGVEHLDALATKTVDLEVVGKTGFTTDGSFNSVKVNVGNHELFYTGATRDSSLFTGSGWDQVRLIDQPDAAGTQYWAVVRRADGEMDLYSLYSGYKVQIEDGGTTWGNTNGRLNYGEVDEIYAAARNRGAGDLHRPGQDLGDTGDRGSFDNIDLSNAAVDTYTDRFIAASFKSVNYASQNLHVGTAIVETFAGDTVDGTQSASRDHITSNGNHHLIVDEEATEIDGHLRLYVRDNESGLYNRFNEVYLGTSAGNTNVNTYNTTSLNAYATNQGTGQGATSVLGTAMYGFGGNDNLTGGSDVDYLFGGESTYTTIPGVLQGNIVTGGNGGDFFGVGNISAGADGDAVMTTNFTARLDGTAPLNTSPSGTLFRTGASETADLATRVATDRIQDWTAGVDSLRVLANGTAVIDGLGTPDGAAGAYNPDIIEDDPEKIDVSGGKVINEGKIVVRGLGNDDTIIGSDGSDWLYGNDGDNVVIAGAVGAGDGNDRVFYDTYAGRVFVGGFDSGDKIYLNKKVLDAISGSFIRNTEAADNLTTGGQTYTAAVAYNPEINFLHDTFYGPSGALPSNTQHVNGPGFVDGSDNYADASTGIIGGGMFAAGMVLNVFLPGTGYALMAAGTALGAGAVAGELGWTTPHQHATYSGNISGNFLTVLTAQNNVDTRVAVDGDAQIDNKSFLEFFASADAKDGYTPAVQFTSLNPNQAINQFMAVHSDEETFIYWVYSRDAIVTAGEAVKVAEINGKLFAEDFAIYDGTLDVYNYGTLPQIVIYTPSILSVGYDRPAFDDDFVDAGEVSIAPRTSVVVAGNGRFVVEGQFFRDIGSKDNPFTTTANDATVTVSYADHGLVTNDWVQISGATPANGVDFNGTYRVTRINDDEFTFEAQRFSQPDPALLTPATVADVVNGAAGVSATFGVAGVISENSTIKIYDGVDRLDANPLNGGDDVYAEITGARDSFKIYDTRGLGTSLTQAPDGVVTFADTDGDLVDDPQYQDAQGTPAYFTTTDTDATVAVFYENHALTTGDSITIAGATDANGIEFNGTWVVTRIDDDRFTFEADSVATAGGQVGTSFSFTKVSAPVDVANTDIVAAAGVLTVDMANHGMLNGDSITFTSSFRAGNYHYADNTAYTVNVVNDGRFQITSTVQDVGPNTIPANVTFSVPNGGDQTFFLRDEKVSYYVEVTNADSGFETMSLQYDFTVGGGTTTLNGGRGTDTLVISDESAALNGMVDGQIVNLEVIQTTNGAADPMTLDLSKQSEGFTFYDSDAGNNLTGGQGNDTIYGFDGNDVIDGHTGDDSIIGGNGADTLDGSGGNDVFVYATAADLFSGGNLVDSITGGDDADTIKIDQANSYTIAVTDSFARANEVETLAAGGDNAGNISITLHADAFSTADIRQVTLAADTNAAGTNTINASSQTNGAVDLTLTGSAGADSITGGSGDDNVSGGSGNDTITGGDGADALTGGLGNDVFVYAATSQVSTDDIVEATNGGVDRIIATSGINFSGLTVNGSADLEGAGADEGIEQIVLEGQTNSTFTGSQLTGNTIAINESDNDGNTTLTISVAGSSTVDFSNLTFAAVGAGSGAEAFDDGADVVAITSVAGNTAENVTGTTIADTINLDDGNDIVDGGAGNDTINGGAGEDTITGGSGVDVLDGGNGNDQFIYNSDTDFVSGNVVVDDIDGGVGTADRVSVTDTGGFTITAGDLDGRISNVEILDLGSVAKDFTGTINITLNDADLASDIRSIDLSNDNSNDSSTVNLSAITNDDNNGSTGGFAVTAGADNTLIVGTANNDTINGSTGDNVIWAGKGLDQITVSAAGSSDAVIIVGDLTSYANGDAKMTTINTELGNLIGYAPNLDNTYTTDVVATESIAFGAAADNDLLYTFGVVDLSGVSLTGSYSIVAHSSIVLREDQFANIEKITFVGSSSHNITVKAANGDTIEDSDQSPIFEAWADNGANQLAFTGGATGLGVGVFANGGSTYTYRANPATPLLINEPINFIERGGVQPVPAGSPFATSEGVMYLRWDKGSNNNPWTDFGSNPDRDDEFTTATRTVSQYASVGDRFTGLNFITYFEPGTTQLPIPDTFGSYGDNAVHREQFEVYAGSFDVHTGVFTVGKLPSSPANYTPRQEFTLILYDDDPSVRVGDVEGIVFANHMEERDGWQVLARGTPAAELEFNDDTPDQSNGYGYLGLNEGNNNEVLDGTGARAGTTDYIYGMGGNDLITAGDGDFVFAGTGADTVIGAAGENIIDLGFDSTVWTTNGDGDADVLVLEGGHSDAVSDSDAPGTQGQDFIYNFEFAHDIIEVNESHSAAGAGITYTHASHVKIGTVGAQSFTTDTITINLDGNATIGDDDLVFTLKNTDQQTVSEQNVQDRIRYDLVGSNHNDNITAGMHGDTIDGGGGNDTIVGAAGADVLSGGAGDDTFSITALADITGLAEAIYGGALAGADSGNDRIVFDVAGSADISSATISGIETLVLNGGSNSITMTANQHNGFTSGFTGGGVTDQVTLTTAGTVTASSAVEQYVLSGAGASTITLGAVNQNVTEDGATEQANTIVFGSGVYTGTFTNFDAADTYEVVNGSNLAAVVGLDAGILDFQDGNNVGVTLDAAQNGTLTATNTTNTQTITLTEADTFTALAGIENYVLSGAGASTITLGAVNQNVTEDGATEQANTIVFGSGIYTGTFTNFDAADTYEVVNGSNLAAVVGLDAGILDFQDGNNVGVALDAAQNGTLTATNTTNTQTITLTEADTFTALAGIENYVLAAGSNSATSAEAGQSFDANSLLDGQALSLAGSHDVSVSLIAGDLNSASTGNVTVTATTGTNVITTGSGDDTISAGDGNDVINSGAGNDTVTGGAGYDTFYVGAAGTYTTTITDLGVGGDKVQLNTAGGAIVSATLGANFTADSDTWNRSADNAKIVIYTSGYDLDLDLTPLYPVNGSLAGAGFTVTVDSGESTVRGSDYADIITGGTFADSLEGGSGADLITGGGGADTIRGGVGADSIDGGSGADTIIIVADANTDVISISRSESADGSEDQIQGFEIGHDRLILTGDHQATSIDLSNLTVASGEYQLGDDDVIIYSDAAGTTALTATDLTANIQLGTATDAYVTTGNVVGGDFDDYISGGAGTQIFSGGAGADVITGGAGVDTLTGGLGADTFNHNLATDSGDTITDFTVGTDNFILTTTGLVDSAGGAVAANAIVAGSFATIDGTAAGSAALAAGDVIIELDQATLGVALDFSASSSAQIVTAVEALFAGNNWDTGNAAAAYVESGNSEDLLFIVYEAAAQGATADAVLIRATGDGAADSFDGEFTVEAVLTSVAADALTSADFIT